MVGDLLVPSFSRNPSRHARRLARRYAAGQLVECDAYLAAGPRAPAEPGRLRLCAGGPALWRPRPRGRLQPWGELTLLQGIGVQAGAARRRAEDPTVCAYSWHVRAADGSDGLLLIDAPFGPRFALVVARSRFRTS